uniref:Uncharacterized protein n=1 Tax=Panagrolaimus sp. JU765 TaxID=591449 RepID=A0AC34QQ23_9BILA
MDSSDGETNSEMEYELMSPQPGPSNVIRQTRRIPTLKCLESAKRLADMLDRIQIEPEMEDGEEVDEETVKKALETPLQCEVISEESSSESSDDEEDKKNEEVHTAIIDAIERYIKFNENRPKLPIVDEINGLVVRELPDSTDESFFDDIREKKRDEPLRKRPRVCPRTRSQSKKLPGKAKKQVMFKVPELPERLKRKKANPNNNLQRFDTNTIVLDNERIDEPMEMETKNADEKNETDKSLPPKEKFMDYLIPRIMANDGEALDEETDGETSEKGEEGDDENEEDETNKDNNKMEDEPSPFWCHVKALNDDFKNKTMSADDYHEELLKAFCYRIDMRKKLDPIKYRRQTKIMEKAHEENPSILAKSYLESFHETYADDQNMKHETPKMKLLPEFDRLSPKARGQKDDFVIVKGDIVRACSHRTNLPSYAQVRSIFADETTKDYALLTWLEPISKDVNIHVFDPKNFKHAFEDEQFYPLENLTVECHRPKLYEYQEHVNPVAKIVHKKHRKYLKKKLKFIAEQKRRDEETPRPEEEVARRPRSPLPVWISRRETYKKKKSGMIVLSYIVEAGQQPLEND